MGVSSLTRIIPKNDLRMLEEGISFHPRMFSSEKEVRERAPALAKRGEEFVLITITPGEEFTIDEG